jgi:Phytanoyl-CoA dioxygenase (PhyH)
VTTARANGADLDMSPAAFGELRPSDDLLTRPGRVLQRLEEDGYVYLPGFWNREDLTPVRGEVAAILAEAGAIDPADPLRMTFRAPVSVELKRKIANSSPMLRRFLREGRTSAFLQAAWQAGVRALDFVGMRIISPGPGTCPHADIVYFSRGTPRLLTGWTPLGDIPLEVGGLIVLENSHHNERLRRTYLTRDVDSYCLGRRDSGRYARNEIRWNGALTTNFVKIRNALGGRWLTADYRQGDLVLFVMHLVHGSLDNQSDVLRLSADPRYQRMDEPADHRYIGAHPILNTQAAKRGRVC